MDYLKCIPEQRKFLVLMFSLMLVTSVLWLVRLLVVNGYNMEISDGGNKIYTVCQIYVAVAGVVLAGVSIAGLSLSRKISLPGAWRKGLLFYLAGVILSMLVAEFEFIDIRDVNGREFDVDAWSALQVRQSCYRFIMAVAEAAKLVGFTMLISATFLKQNTKLTITGMYIATSVIGMYGYSQIAIHLIVVILAMISLVISIILTKNDVPDSGSTVTSPGNIPSKIPTKASHKTE